jgi:hypothetical protein
MTYDNEAIVRHAYHTTEGNVLDVAGFVGSFANDGVINLGHADGRRCGDRWRHESLVTSLYPKDTSMIDTAAKTAPPT